MFVYCPFSKRSFEIIMVSGSRPIISDVARVHSQHGVCHFPRRCLGLLNKDSDGGGPVTSLGAKCLARSLAVPHPPFLACAAPSAKSGQLPVCRCLNSEETSNLIPPPRRRRRAWRGKQATPSPPQSYPCLARLALLARWRAFMLDRWNGMEPQFLEK